MKVSIPKQKVSNVQLREITFRLLIAIAGDMGLKDEILRTLKDCNIKYELKEE